MTEHDHGVACSRHLYFNTPLRSIPSLEYPHLVRHSGSQCRGQRLPSGESRVFLVPVLHALFSQLPAEQHGLPVHLAGKIDEARVEPLDLHTELANLRQVTIDVARQLLRLPLEPVGMFVSLVRHARGCDLLVFANLFLPAPIVTHYIANDTPDERQCPICVLDRELRAHTDTLRSGLPAVNYQTLVFSSVPSDHLCHHLLSFVPRACAAVVLSQPRNGAARLQFPESVAVPRQAFRSGRLPRKSGSTNSYAASRQSEDSRPPPSHLLP